MMKSGAGTDKGNFVDSESELLHSKGDAVRDSPKVGGAIGCPTRKRRKPAKFKKHPNAPKRFRSAFILFSQQRHKELRAHLPADAADFDTINVSGQISEEWRRMGSSEKVEWEEAARCDMARYEREKAEYDGPWKVRSNQRKPKDPTSPKKPVPAYFAFSNERRQMVKDQNPSSTNGEISQILSRMWKDAPIEIRQRYLDEEARARKKHNLQMAEWRKQKKEKEENEAALGASASEVSQVTEESEKREQKTPAKQSSALEQATKFSSSVEQVSSHAKKEMQTAGSSALKAIKKQAQGRASTKEALKMSGQTARLEPNTRGTPDVARPWQASSPQTRLQHSQSLQPFLPYLSQGNDSLVNAAIRQADLVHWSSTNAGLLDRLVANRLGVGVGAGTAMTPFPSQQLLARQLAMQNIADPLTSLLLTDRHLPLAMGQSPLEQAIASRAMLEQSMASLVSESISGMPPIQPSIYGGDSLWARIVHNHQASNFNTTNESKSPGSR